MVLIVLLSFYVNTVNKIYCGNNMYQRYSNEWRDKEDEVIINQGTKVVMRGTEIVFTTGVSVTGGASLHAYLGQTGNCSEDMSQRNGQSDNYIPKVFHEKQILVTEKKQEKEESFSVLVYPNPKNQDQLITVELRKTKGANCEFYDITGRLVHEERIVEGRNLISFQHTASSLLILKITSYENKVAYHKLAVY